MLIIWDNSFLCDFLCDLPLLIYRLYREPEKMCIAFVDNIVAKEKRWLHLEK